MLTNVNQLFMMKAPEVELGEVGYFKDLPNEAYHKGPGISKSQLDLIHKSPALYKWSKEAPEDEKKKGALNVGDAMHALLLEPERFKQEFAVGPENASKKTNAGKEKWAEFESTLNGRAVITAEDYRKLELMRQSVLAHPQGKWLLDAPGEVEASIYWKDDATDLLCRVRPDKTLSDHQIIVDVKTTSDMEKFKYSVRDYRYDVQDAFYSEGFYRHFCKPVQHFVFLVVSTSVQCGRYPVRIWELTKQNKDEGWAEMRQDIETAAECMRTNNWPGIEVLSTPPRNY